MFTSDEIGRYAQQIKLEQVGVEGQQKLKKASILCIGAGGLGSSLLLYLANAGIGTIGLVEDDVVEQSNLHRQILYREKHLQQPKVLIAKAELEACNPHIQIQAHHERLSHSNAKSLVSQYDLVVDCCDNLASRYIIHETCYQLDKPYIYASVLQFQGYCSVFYGKNNPCLQCLFPPSMQQLPSCGQAGVLGVLPGILGMLQANEVIKWILNIGTPLLKQLLMVDLLTMSFKKIELAHNPDCELCNHKQSETSKSIRMDDIHSFAIQPGNFLRFMQENPEVLLLDVRTQQEHQQANLGGMLIPLQELEARLNELPRDKPILVYCKAGPRSLAAFNILRLAQFQQLYYLESGMSGLHT